MSKENNYIKFQCSKGLHVLTAPKQFAGKKGRCLSCYEELTIPNRTPDDFIPPPQNLSDYDAEDYEKYVADNYSDSDSVRFEQTLYPGDLSVKSNCGRCKEAFTFCSRLPDPRKGNFTLFELDKLKKLPKNFDTRFYCIDCLTEFFRGSHTSRPSQEEISKSSGLSYEVDGKTYLKPLGEGLKQRIPARPESEVLAGGNKKQEPLSNNNQSKVALSLMFGALIMGAIFLIPWHWIGKGISSTAEVLGDFKMPSIALTSNANQSGLNRNVESWERFVNSLKEKASRELRRLNKEFDGGSVFRVRYINDDVQRTKSLRNPIVGELTFVIEQDQLALLAIQQKAEDLRKLNDRLRQSINIANNDSAPRLKVEETHTEYREYTKFKLTYARKGDSWEFLNGHSTKLLDPSEKEQGKTESFGIGNTPTTLGLSSFINN